MGCISSREAKRDRRLSPAPYIRSQSMPIHNVGSSSGKVRDGNRHVVVLTSSTLGTLKLEDDESVRKASNDDKTKEWSEMINRKIPKTPTKTPSNEHETINTWELMEGLEEAEVDRPRIGDKSFSFSNVDALPKPLWMQVAPGDSIVASDFDPEILSNFRKALDELSPQHQGSPRSPEPIRTSTSETSNFEGIVKARVNDFEKKFDTKRGVTKCKGPPNGERKVVIYTTSLRGIRKTYEDCWTVKMIVRGYGVKVDERDVSMHMGFREELNEILGVGFGGNRLPRVFVNGKYLGGADEVRQMHEVGELGKELECEATVVGKGGGVCEGCGDVRFVPCENCSGSCKVFVEDEDVACGFRRCPDCNENGLVRCPLCL